MNRSDRIEDFDVIAGEIDASLDDLLACASDLNQVNDAVLVAALAGVIREKVAALTLIFEELTNIAPPSKIRAVSRLSKKI